MKHEQPRLADLMPYPFERLKTLLSGMLPPSSLLPIDASAGEPKLPIPEFLRLELEAHVDEFGHYPPTRGTLYLREAAAEWMCRRFALKQLDPVTQVLSANGTREALFSVAHALVNPEEPRKSYVLMPNPMYQIYFGAAKTAGAEPYFFSHERSNGFTPDLKCIPESVWLKTSFVYLCSPHNPTGWVADRSFYFQLLNLADRYDFYVCADECYSEIYMDEPPTSLLEAAQDMGNTSYARCLVFNSLSKRSGLPGLRSGFIAGDASLIARFAKLRSYTGPATPLPLQRVAAHAWRDEAHVIENRKRYRHSVQAFYSALGRNAIPKGGFFAWLPVEDDEAFTIRAFQEQAVTVLPGRYLACEGVDGRNPGSGYVRIALTHEASKTVELAERLKSVGL